MQNFYWENLYSIQIYFSIIYIEIKNIPTSSLLFLLLPFRINTQKSERDEGKLTLFRSYCFLYCILSCSFLSCFGGRKKAVPSWWLRVGCQDGPSSVGPINGLKLILWASETEPLNCHPKTAEKSPTKHPR